MAAWTLPQRIAEWCKVLSTGWDRRSRKDFAPIVLGMLLASGRRTVSSWLKAAGVSDDWQDHDYFLQTLGRSAGRVATELLFLVVRQIPASHVGPYVKRALDDSPTKRYGPQVQLAGIHHNPTPGPSGSQFLYGHVWVTIRWLVTHPLWGCIGLPLRALMDVRRKDLDPLTNIGRAPWSFRTKRELAAELVEWCVTLFQNAFHALWSRTDRHLQDIPGDISPAGGAIRVVIVKRSPELFVECPSGWSPSSARTPVSVPRRSSRAWPTGRRSNRTFTTSRKSTVPESNRSATCGAIWRAGTCACGCIRWWSYGRGDVRGRRSDNDPIDRGTNPHAGRVTRIASKP